MQTKALRQYTSRRKWAIAIQVAEISSAALSQPKRNELLKSLPAT
jgi:hypothetical protein